MAIPAYEIINEILYMYLSPVCTVHMCCNNGGCLCIFLLSIIGVYPPSKFRVPGHGFISFL
jgi:hypothetical protein